MPTPLDGDCERVGDLELTSPAFDHGGRLPDSTGYVNDNANPPLAIDGVPEEAESLVLVVDDPDARPVAGHTWDHWLVWDVDPHIGTIPEDWTADDGEAVEGYNDHVERGYGGPSPPDGSHEYRFKLLALDSALEMPPETRKARLGSAHLDGRRDPRSDPARRDVRRVAGHRLLTVLRQRSGEKPNVDGTRVTPRRPRP